MAEPVIGRSPASAVAAFEPWLARALELMVHPGQGSALRRQRGAREALAQARALGASPSTVVSTAHSAALGCLAQALDQAALPGASWRCGALAAQQQGPLLDCQTLDSWVVPRSIRLYQEWLLRGRRFRLRLHDGIYVLVSFRADSRCNRLLLQRHTDGSRWVLLSGECGEAYALADQPLRRPGLQDAGESLSGAAVARAGNDNFAHFLWNELDPLLRARTALTTLEVVQDSDTVLDLGQLRGIRRLDPAVLSQRPSVRLGGTLVTAAARAAVLAALVAEPLDPLPPGRDQPLVLLGVRGPGRRELVNEEPFYAALIAALRQRYGCPLIVLDGFTYQHDNQANAAARQREQACTARVKRIIAASGGQGLECLSGLDFANWLRRTEGLRCYVTHEGTMQHKVGWLRPQIPGLLLVAGANAGAIAAWHRQQCEGAVPLLTLPPSLLAQEAPAPDLPPLEMRNQPFCIRNVALAVEVAMAMITACIDGADLQSFAP